MATSDYLILFGDLIGSTEVASEASPSLFSKLYIGSFHLAAQCAQDYITNPVFTTVKFSKIIEGMQLSGDEVLSFTDMTGLNEDQKTDLIASAVTFAFMIKTFWMASPYNILRLHEKKFFRDIALGIHIGPAERISDDAQSDIAGLHINVTKRLETAARSANNSRILVSDDVNHYFSGWLKKWSALLAPHAPPLLYTIFDQVQSPLDLKGIPVKVTPFELQLNKENKAKIRELLELIFSTPERIGAEAEDAVRILGDTFLEKLFQYRSLLDQIKDIKTTDEYISHWFDAVDHLPHLFLHDLWTVMVVFFICCGFNRRCDLNVTKRNSYQERTKRFRSKLIELLENPKK